MLDSWNYCPLCGGRFVSHDGRSRRCEACGFIYYLNASAATAAFIINARGELLVCRRAKEPAKGTLDLPGGFVDPGESIEEGMRREIREETGCEVATMRYLFGGHNDYTFSGFVVPTADCFFLVTLPPDAAPVGCDDAQDMQWLPLSEVRAEEFGLHSIARAVARFLLEFKP